MGFWDDLFDFDLDGRTTLAERIVGYEAYTEAVNGSDSGRRTALSAFDAEDEDDGDAFDLLDENDMYDADDIGCGDALDMNDDAARRDIRSHRIPYSRYDIDEDDPFAEDTGEEDAYAPYIGYAAHGECDEAHDACDDYGEYDACGEVIGADDARSIHDVAGDLLLAADAPDVPVNDDAQYGVSCAADAPDADGAEANENTRNLAEAILRAALASEDVQRALRAQIERLRNAPPDDERNE